MKKLVIIVLLILSAVLFAAPVRSNLGGDGIERGETVSYTAADYVQDGLVFMLDGVENAGWGVHDSEATEWTDLVSGRALALSEGVFFGNNHAYVSEGFSSKFWIISSWKPRNLCATAVFETYDSAAMQIVYVDAYVRKVIGVYGDYVGVGLRQSVVYAGAADGRIVSVTSLYDDSMASTALLANVNGLFYDQFGGGADFSTAKSSAMMIGGGYRTSADKHLNGRIYNVRLYDRQLTDEEVLHNYEIDKERFGL